MLVLLWWLTLATHRPWTRPLPITWDRAPWPALLAPGPLPRPLTASRLGAAAATDSTSAAHQAHMPFLPELEEAPPRTLRSTPTLDLLQALTRLVGSTAGLPRRLSSLPAMVLLQPAPETTSTTRQRATPLPSCRRALEISRSATKMLVRTVVLPRRASRRREQLAAVYAVELVQHMFAFYRKWFLICS